MTTTTEELALQRHGSILVARLNRPEVSNAFNATLFRGIGATLHAAESDPDIHVVVLTGTGDRAFCAGTDPRAFRDPEELRACADEATLRFIRFMHGKAGIPVVGAANGTAAGRGLELLLGCDVVLASASAKLIFPKLTDNKAPEGGDARGRPRLPLAVSLELTLIGETLDARRAHELGLVHSVHQPSEVLPAAMRVAKRIADDGVAPTVVNGQTRFAEGRPALRQAR